MVSLFYEHMKCGLVLRVFDLQIEADKIKEQLSTTDVCNIVVLPTGIGLTLKSESIDKGIHGGVL